MYKFILERVIKDLKPRNTWDKGVKAYALELLENAPEMFAVADLRNHLLKGEYNEIDYNEKHMKGKTEKDVIERLYSPAAAKKYLACRKHVRDWQVWQRVALTDAINMIMDNAATCGFSWDSTRYCNTPIPLVTFRRKFPGGENQYLSLTMDTIEKIVPDFSGDYYDLTAALERAGVLN